MRLKNLPKDYTAPYYLLAHYLFMHEHKALYRNNLQRNMHTHTHTNTHTKPNKQKTTERAAVERQMPERCINNIRCTVACDSSLTLIPLAWDNALFGYAYLAYDSYHPPQASLQFKGGAVFPVRMSLTQSFPLVCCARGVQVQRRMTLIHVDVCITMCWQATVVCQLWCSELHWKQRVVRWLLTGPDRILPGTAIRHVPSCLVYLGLHLSYADRAQIFGRIC